MSTISRDGAGHSPFRAAVEAKDISRLESVLAPGVQFRSPVVYRPYEGREAVSALLRVVGTVILPELRYVWQLAEGDREVLCFHTRVGAVEVEGVDLLHYGADGLVDELVVMMRPASALAAVRDAIGEQLRQAAST